MKYFLVLSALFFYSKCLPQDESKQEELGTLNCRRMEKDAQVDMQHWQNYLSENLMIDSLTQEDIPAGTYKLAALFIVDKRGCIEHVKIIGDPGYGFAEKVIKVISAYQLWMPAEFNGRKVKSYRRQEITFIVENENTACQEEKRLIDFIL